MLFDTNVAGHLDLRKKEKKKRRKEKRRKTNTYPSRCTEAKYFEKYWVSYVPSTDSFSPVFLVI